MKGSGFAIMNADGTRTEDPTITDFGKLHNRFTDLLRASVREHMSPPVDPEKAVMFVQAQLTDPVELEGAGELFANMDWRGGWDGDL